MVIKAKINIPRIDTIHCVKSVHIRSYSGLYSVRMRENTDQNNSEYGHFLQSDMLSFFKLILAKFLSFLCI